jgi:chemotaxis protein CheX
MAQTELKAKKPEKKVGKTAHGDVSGLIGMVGPSIKGSFSLTFDEPLALTIMQRMVGESPEEINPEVADMVGEITNMVCGGAKLELSNKGHEFNMATPMVVSGKEHNISHQIDGPTLMMHFSSDSGNACLEICFEPT